MILNRFYHVSCVAHSMKKQGLKLNKMLSPRSKRQWYPTPQSDGMPLPSLKSLTKVKSEPGKQATRRVAMLNKLFMKHITDLMSTGTVSMDIIGRGIEISKVQVSYDFKTVSVFWVCKGNSTDAETEALLNKLAGPLRHELSTLRAMGEVPYVMFHKDKQEARLVDLDRCLAIADYGDDYKSTDIGHLLKTEFTLDTKLSPEMKAKIKQLEDEIDVTETPLPEMTHNVFGLDHAKIMGRLLAARKKSSDAWRNLQVNEDSTVMSFRAPKNATDVDTGKQKAELADFLKKRQILQNKLYKQKERELRQQFLYLDDFDDDDSQKDDSGEQSEDEYDYETQEHYYSGLTAHRPGFNPGNFLMDSSLDSKS